MYALFRLYSQYKSRGYHIQQHNQCSFLPVFVVLTLKGVSPYDAFIPFVPSPWFQTDRASPFRPSGIPDDTLVGAVHHPRARRKMATDENGEAKAGKGLAGMAQAVVLQIIASVRALYVRSAPWLMLVRRSIGLVEAGRGGTARECRVVNGRGAGISSRPCSSFACSLVRAHGVLGVVPRSFACRWRFWRHRRKRPLRVLRFQRRGEGAPGSYRMV